MDPPPIPKARQKQNVAPTTSSATPTPANNSKATPSSSGKNGPRKGMEDEPLQFIDFHKTADNTSITLRGETIDHVFGQIGDKPVSIICVCGPSRQGKSFLLGYMIRCLEGLEKEEDDWMGWDEKTKPLKGFKFRNGAAPETQGIWVWSRPFIVKNDEGKEVAIILVDTQGTYDEFTTNKDMSAIVGLSLLTSSVMIFNFFSNLQEDVLLALNTYTDYGSIALDMGDDSGPPFQKLNFLIRDWNNPTEFAYGGKGGKQFLDEKLRTKEGQPPQAKHIRETIRKCFQELDCFLMPSIGEKALGKDFQGSISEVNLNFAKKMEEFLNDLISAENLTIKEIMGSPVSAQELRTFLEKYVEIFNSDDVPSAENMWQATSQMCNNAVLEKALKKYRDLMKKKKTSTYVSEEDLDEAHSKAEKQALELFKKAKKFGTPEIISEIKETLQERIEAEFSEMKRLNKDKRDKIISEATTEAVDMFKSQLEDYFPLNAEDDTQFYDEPNMKTTSDMNKATCVEEFQLKLSTEREDKLKDLVATLETTFDNMLKAHLNINSIHRSNAEKFMAKIVQELSFEHNDKLQDYLKDNKYEGDEDTLQEGHDAVKSEVLELFQQRKKPGKKDFHKDYFAKLETEMDKNFSSQVKGHQLQIQETAQNVEKSLRKYSSQYELEMSDSIDDDDMDEDELDNLHLLKMTSLLRRFQEQDNPFPIDSHKGNELETKLKELLQQAFTKFKSDLSRKNQESLESCRKAAERALDYYNKEMTRALSTDPTEDNLKLEHDRVLSAALTQFENSENVGTSKNSSTVRPDLESKIGREWDKFRDDHKIKLELASSKTQNLVRDCFEQYNKILKVKMETSKTENELLESHEKAKAQVLETLQQTFPVNDPTILDKKLAELDQEIEESFEELMDIFKMKMAEENTTKKGLFLETRRQYHDQMAKHCMNNQFITPQMLQNIHEQTKETVMKESQAKNALNSKQIADLEADMEDLLKKYVDENNMKLNSAKGVAPAIGIDLGTTYCCVGVYYQGDVHIIKNLDQDSAETTPSYVAFERDGTVRDYGKSAKENAYRDPENTIYDAKRMIGRKINDPKLQSDMKLWPFVVQDDGGIPKIKVHGQLLFPEQVSAKLLIKFREMSETFLNLPKGTIKKAVITVPAYFNDGQRQATVDAGELAGLEVLTILNEPTAAAIAYSLKRFDSDPKKILIYDLGGGTFDVAVLEMKPKKIEVLGVNGDTHLGGEDFDMNMMKYCAACFKNDHRIDLFEGLNSNTNEEKLLARRRLMRLRTSCEKAKRDLTSAKRTEVSVDAIFEEEDLSVSVTREKFEELNASEFKRSIMLVEEALKEVGVRKEQIDDVVLVGGSSRILKVQEMVRDFFNGKALNKSIHPDFAVAYGAAVQAALMNGEQSQGKIDLDKIDDVTPMSLGIETARMDLAVVIPKNTKIPTTMNSPFYTASDYQTSVNFPIYQGEDFKIAANNKLLGEFMLTGVPSKRQGEEVLDVCMDINAMGILHVTATCKSTMGSNSIVVQEDKQRMDKTTKMKLMERES